MCDTSLARLRFKIVHGGGRGLCRRTSNGGHIIDGRTIAMWNY